MSGLYYKDDYVEIWHGDCRDVLPMLPRADLVLTDPPWGINGGSGSINKTRAKGNYSDKFSDDAVYIGEVVVPVIRHCIALCACVVVTPGFNFSAYPNPDSFGCFYMPASVGMQRFGHGDAQPIFYYGRNVRNSNLNPCSYVLTEVPDKNGHPCPKPLRAWTRLLGNISLPDHVVFDPFMGSGTTLRAAKDLGRKAIGIEIEERYCEIAAKRCNEAQPSMYRLLEVRESQGALING
jgi:site-specific DNA-methyltransferase (adenine-specific)